MGREGDDTRGGLAHGDYSPDLARSPLGRCRTYTREYRRLLDAGVERGRAQEIARGLIGPEVSPWDIIAWLKVLVPLAVVTTVVVLVLNTTGFVDRVQSPECGGGQHGITQALSGDC